MNSLDCQVYGRGKGGRDGEGPGCDSGETAVRTTIKSVYNTDDPCHSKDFGWRYHLEGV